MVGGRWRGLGVHSLAGQILFTGEFEIWEVCLGKERDRRERERVTVMRIGDSYRK